MSDSLPEILDDLWSRLEAGAASNRSPWHLGVLSTVRDMAPTSRTVVLRSVDRADGVIRCHTDLRAGKVADAEANPAVAWAFYDAQAKVQLRVEGVARILRGGDERDACWRATGAFSRRCYMAPDAPGSTATGPTSGLPPEVEHRAPTLAESESGARNFGVLATRVEALEWLWLSVKGHRRARWTRGADGAFRGEWLVP